MKIRSVKANIRRKVFEVVAIKTSCFHSSASRSGRSLVKVYVDSLLGMETHLRTG